MFLGLQILTLSQETSLPVRTNYFESLILNTDRDLYFAGEKIWFKVSCFDNEQGSESIMSKIVYIELYDYKTVTITKAKFRIVSGIATGFIKIPEHLSSGNYYLRVYTQFLRNYSPNLYASSLISVINPKKAGIQDEKTLNDDILIIPEGGILLAGIPMRLALRINPILMKGLNESIILDNNENIISEFTPYENGLALVNFTPESTSQYFLKLMFDNGDSIIKPLQPVIKNGMLFRSTHDDSTLNISLISNSVYSDKLKTSYKVEIRSQNYNNLFVRNIKLNETIVIKNNQIPEGIIYVLLKNKNDEIIDVHSKFISKVTSEVVVIRKNKDVYKPRELVELNINLPEDWSIKDKYLISVTKEYTHINSKNLLPSHIAYNPIFLSNYLKNVIVDSDSLKRQIDIALILYSNIYNSKKFKGGFKKKNIIWLPEIRGVSISGKLINKNTKTPLSGMMVYASVFGDSKQLHLYKTKTNGDFIFSLNHLQGKQNVFIGIKPNDTLQAKILINQDFSNEYPYSCSIPFNPDSSYHKSLERIYVNALVNKAFEHCVDKVNEDISYYTSLNNDPGDSFLLKNFIDIPLMSEVFDEIIPFVSTRKRKEQYSLSIYNNLSGKTHKDPQVLVDGVPVFDINQIMKIETGLINKISVSKRKYYIGDYRLNGVISLTSSTKDFAGIEFPDESVFIEYLTVTPESYPIFPQYNSVIKKDRTPDFRNLLYWNFLSEKGSARVSFYTSDNYGDFEINIKGYNKGKLYLGKTYITVEKHKN